MAAVDQLSPRGLPAGLPEQAASFEFVQLVRLLERAAADKAALGSAADPAREAVSLRAKVGFEFSTSDVLGASDTACPGKVRVDVAFMGLAGNEGPLPQPYAELVLQRSRRAGAPQAYRPPPGQPDDDARDFLDIFNHRLLSYFYVGRKKHSIALEAERTDRAPLLERILFQLIGYDEGVAAPGAPRAAATVDPRCLLPYAGILAGRQRSMAGLETILADAFGTCVRGTQQQGCWLPIDPDFRSVIGPRGKNRALGLQTVLGRRALDARGKIGLAIGPLPLADYEALLPGGAGHARLVFLVRFYLREDVDVEVALALAVPQAGAAAAPARLGLGRLGRSAWLGQGGARPGRGARFLLERARP